MLCTRTLSGSSRQAARALQNRKLNEKEAEEALAAAADTFGVNWMAVDAKVRAKWAERTLKRGYRVALSVQEALKGALAE